MSTIDKDSESRPSQISGIINQIKGGASQVAGDVTGEAEWAESGERLYKKGQEELDAARNIAQKEAKHDRLHGKGQSALGMLTGNQDKQTEGNVRAEQAEWKAATARGEFPSMSTERLKGKLESAVGMITGNQDKQKEGNIRAEKAEWTQE